MCTYDIAILMNWINWGILVSVGFVQTYPTSIVVLTIDEVRNPHFISKIPLSRALWPQKKSKIKLELTDR